MGSIKVPMAKKTLPKRTSRPVGATKKAVAGKAVFVLAHGAGHAAKGCKHKDIQAWAKALRAQGDVVDTLKYGKPYNLMGNLCTAHAAVIQKAIRSKARPVVLVSFGMGARVAVHMMGKTPGDDGKPLPALPKNSPKTLFIVGPKDAHMDYAKLAAIRKSMKSKTKVISLPDGESERPADMKEVVQQIAQLMR